MSDGLPVGRKTSREVQSSRFCFSPVSINTIRQSPNTSAHREHWRRRSFQSSPSWPRKRHGVFLGSELSLT